jgi:thiol-disulfide isomerase/thioredoxin
LLCFESLRWASVPILQACEPYKVMDMNMKLNLVKFAILFTLIMYVLSTMAMFAIPPKVNPLPSDFDTGLTYQQALKAKKPMIVDFYVDWCGYCRRIAPVLDSISMQYKNNFNLVLINCENKEYSKLIKDFGIYEFPTVYIIDPKNDNRILINSQFYDKPDKLKMELDRFLKANKYKK